MAEKSNYQPTAAEAEVLSVATKKAMSAGGGSGASAGGRFASRFLKPHTAETTVETRSEPGICRSRASEAILGSGRVIDDPNAADDDAVWGLVASGAMNMMPALVRVKVTEQSGGGSRADVRATGNEGLIKQKIGAKAADRIAEAIARP